MKLFTKTVAILFVCLSIISCKKNDEHSTKNITIDATIAPGETYKLNLKEYQDADDIAIISTQATGNFVSSEITTDASTLQQTYTYQAFAKFAGNDKVVIDINENHPRRSCSNKNDTEARITINFTIK
jgi:hypothetical protein